MIFPRAAVVGAAYALLVICRAGIAAADDFVPSLVVSDGTREQPAATQPAATEPAATRPASRVAFDVAAGKRLTARWKMTSNSAKAFKDVLVHFYVVRTQRAGQAPPPLEPKDVVIESALTMDFDPGGSSNASVDFRPEKAGTYLVRIEAQRVSGGQMYESFAALDLVVK